MNKTLLIILISAASLFSQDRHKLFTEILTERVNDSGLVDYENIKNDSRLDEYLEAIAKINPDTISNDNVRLAFWINAYNAYTLQVIAENYPLESINDLHTGGLIIGQVIGQTVWHDDAFSINGEKVSLNYIEHEVIRKKFDEPRIHFALVCAAMSCPPLRREAYEGYKLEMQLQNQAEIFLNNPLHNSFDIQEKTAYLSKIMDWYAGDFGDTDEERLLYYVRFIDGTAAESIKQNPSEWDIEFNDYDWSLNKQR